MYLIRLQRVTFLTAKGKLRSRRQRRDFPTESSLFSLQRMILWMGGEMVDDLRTEPEGDASALPHRYMDDRHSVMES